MRSILSLTLSLLAVSPIALAKPLELQDIFEIEWASDPRVAPSGKEVVYLRNHMDIMKDRRARHLWRIDVDGKRHRPLVTDLGNVSQPRWSPDGDRLAFVANVDDRPQIFMRWQDTGDTAAVTRLTASPSGLSWSPDGRWLAFSMHVPEAPDQRVTLPGKPEGAKWAPAPIYVDSLVYRFDGAGYREPGFNQLFVVLAEGGTPRQITTGNYNHRGAPAWTADGKALIFSANRRDDGEYDPENDELYRVELDDGAVSALTSRLGPDGSPDVSPDGRRLLYNGYDDELKGYANSRLYVASVDGKDARSLSTDLDRNVDAPRWSSDGRHIYASYVDGAEGVVARVGLDGSRNVIARGLGGTSLGRPYSGGSFTEARGVVAYTRGTDTRPAEVAVSRNGKTTVLTQLNEDLLGERDVVPVESLDVVSSFDERPIDAWMLKPPDHRAGEKYPLILEIHGGPFANYGPRFALETQLYAAAGYVVVYANPRGSTGYGDEFANLIHHAYPGNDYDDLMSVVDAAIATGAVDPQRLFVTGGSGGGVLTAWIVGSTNRFSAAVVAKPVINWTSFVLTADAYNFFYRYWFSAPPWEAQEQYWKRSPLSKVGNVQTPTLLLTGEADYRTPISESEQFYQALKLRRVDTAMVRIPEASHGIANRPSQLMAKIAYILDWFGRHDANAPAKS